MLQEVFSRSLQVEVGTDTCQLVQTRDEKEDMRISNLAFMAYNYYAETGGSAAMCKAPRGCQGRKESKKRVKQLPEGIQT